MQELLDRLDALQKEEMQSEDSVLAALALAESASPVPGAAAILARLPEKGVPWPDPAHARARRRGREQESTEALFALAERLNQAGYHRALGRLLAELLPEARSMPPLAA
jgi:hypothetical protein